MSQITRCPACETQFKVASDQLRASEGWVRCGQCDEIFDAVAHLVPLDAFPVLSQVVPAHRREAAPAVQPAPPLATPEEGSANPSAEPLPASETATLESLSLTPSASSKEEALTVPGPEASLESSPPVPEVLAEPSPIDDFAAQLQQALDSPLPRAPEPPQALVMEPEAFEEAVDAEEADSSIELDFPSLVPADPLPEDPEPSAAELAQEAAFSGLGDAGQDNAVDPGLLGAKLSFPDDARRPAETDESDLLSDRIAAEMDEVVLHLHESAQEPPVPDWMAQASAVDDAPMPAAQNAPLGGASLEDGLRQDAFSASPSTAEGLSDPTAFAPALSEFPPEPGLDESVEPGAAAAAALGAGAGLVAAATAAASASTSASSPVSLWDRLGVRIALVCATVLLVLGLLVQATVQWREGILAWNRHSLGVLQALCVPFQCTLASPRRIADMVIDASGFRHLQGEHYELSMTLHNRAALPLSMPVLELTLTDAQEQPLVRRVLQPAELEAPAELPAKKRWEATVPVALAIPDLPVAGYRLLAFYP